MYAELDRIDLLTRPDRGARARRVAVQTDHRTTAEIAAAPTVSALFAIARVVTAWGWVAEDGQRADAVEYAVTEPPPPALREALVATGATLVLRAAGRREALGPRSPAATAALVDRLMPALAREAAARVGVRDLAVALRMLEDQTTAAPPDRAVDAHAYWQRVLELAALAGELLRARHPAGRWTECDKGVVPLGFAVEHAGTTSVMLPTNRAQRLIAGDGGQSLLLLLAAADETIAQPADPAGAQGGPVMPSLRDRRSLDLAEIAWAPLFAGPGADHPEVPVIVVGVDGETTFGVLHHAALPRPIDALLAEAAPRLARVRPTLEEIHADDLVLIAATGDFFAAEKLLDAGFLRGLHAELDAPVLAAAVPARGLLVVTPARDAGQLARFARLVRLRFEDSGPRALAPAVLLVEDGAIVDAVTSAPADAPPAGAVDPAHAPASPARASFWQRLFRRKP